MQTGYYARYQQILELLESGAIMRWSAILSSLGLSNGSFIRGVMYDLILDGQVLRLATPVGAPDGYWYVVPRCWSGSTLVPYVFSQTLL
jgi:hypothetical protein